MPNRLPKVRGPKAALPTVAAVQPRPWSRNGKRAAEQAELAAIRAAAETLQAVCQTDRLWLLRALFGGPRTLRELSGETGVAGIGAALHGLAVAGLVEMLADQSGWVLTRRGRQAWLSVRALLS